MGAQYIHHSRADGLCGGVVRRECILCGNFIAPLASVPGNIVQIVVALVIAWPLALPMRKLLRYITHYEH